MADETTTLENFLNFNLRPVLPSRLYLLNKPCSLCHLGTNIRVSKPTCIYRICSTCLARFETGMNKGKSVECPTCSTYWFTLWPSSGDRDKNVPPGTDLFLQVAQRSKEIERQICAGKSFSFPSILRKESTQDCDSKEVEYLGHTTDLLGDTTTLTEGSSVNSLGGDLRDRDSESSENKADLSVLEEPRTSCSSLITNEKAVETPVIQIHPPLGRHISRIFPCKLPSAMKSNRPELKTTRIRFVRFSVAEVPVLEQPIDSSQKTSLKATQNYSASKISRKKRYFYLMWPVVLFILGCIMFECIGQVFIRVFLSPIV